MSTPKLLISAAVAVLLLAPSLVTAENPKTPAYGPDEAISTAPLLLVSPRPAEATPRALLRDRLTQLRTDFRARLDELNAAILAGQDAAATRTMNAELRALKLDFEIDILEAQLEAAPALVDAAKRDDTLESLREAIEALRVQRNATTVSGPVVSADGE